MQLQKPLSLYLFSACLAACATRPPAPPSSAHDSAAVTSANIIEVRGVDTVRGLLSMPRSPGQFAAVLLVHGALGLDDQMKVWTARLASEGYVAFAVDLYGGRVPRNLEEGIAIARTSSAARRQGMIDSAIRFLRSRPKVRADRIGAVGWCSGGAMVFRLAVRDSELLAAAIHYGPVTSEPKALGSVHAAVLGIFGGADQMIPVDSVRAFETQMHRLGKNSTIVIYPGVGHAFEFPGASGPNTNGYHPVESADAWRRTIKFFDENLKRPRLMPSE